MTNEEMERAIALLTERVNRVVREVAYMKPVTTVDPAVGAIDATIAIIDRMNVSLAGSTVTQREEARTFLQRVRLSLGGN